MFSQSRTLTAEEREKMEQELHSDLIELLNKKELSNHQITLQGVLRILKDYTETDFMVVSDILAHAGFSILHVDLDFEVTHILYNMSEEGKLELRDTTILYIVDSHDTAANA